MAVMGEDLTLRACNTAWPSLHAPLIECMTDLSNISVFSKGRVTMAEDTLKYNNTTHYFHTEMTDFII